jgi:predicted ester cyclase
MEASLNAGNADAFVAWFAADGVIREPAGTVVSGKEQLRVYVQGLVVRGYRVESGPRTPGGPLPGTATAFKWTARVTFDGLRTLGVDTVDARAEAVVDRGKVVSYTPPFSPGSMAMMAMAAAIREEAFVRAFYEDVVNQGKLEAAETCLAPGFVDHAPLPGRAPSSTGFREGLAELKVAMPDFRVAVEEVLVAGDRVVVRSTWTGTHQGPYQGAQPTFRSVRVGAIDILRIENGRVAERWEQLDSGSLARQLGLFEPAGPAAGKPQKNSSKKGRTGGILGWLNDL